MHGDNGHAYFLGRDCWSFKEAMKPQRVTECLEAWQRMSQASCADDAPPRHRQTPSDGRHSDGTDKLMAA